MTDVQGLVRYSDYTLEGGSSQEPPVCEKDQKPGKGLRPLKSPRAGQVNLWRSTSFRAGIYEGRSRESEESYERTRGTSMRQ